MKREQKKKVLLYSILITLFLVTGIFVFYYFNEQEKSDVFPLFEPHCDENFHGCKDLTDSGKVYCISGSYGELNVNSTSLPVDKACIDVVADNIILWCLNGATISAGDSIKSDSSAVGMRIQGRSNVKIQGCNLQYWNNTGVLVDNSKGIIIDELRSSYSGFGLIISNSLNINISNPILRNNLIGLELRNSNFSLIFGSASQISENLLGGVKLFSSFNNTLVNLSVYANLFGISFNKSSSNLFDGGLVNANKKGVVIINGSDNLVRNSRIENLDVHSVGMSIDIFSKDNLFYNNKFTNFNNFDPDIAWPVGRNSFDSDKKIGVNIVGGRWSGGNYWGDRDGYGWSQYSADCGDSDGDGVCNNQYISLTNTIIDRYPLSSNPIWTGCNQRLKNYSDGQVTWHDDEIYCLENSILLTDSNPFLNVGANRITIDCNGYRIYSNNSLYNKAIKINDKENITIKNCVFDNFISSNLGDPDTYPNSGPYGIYANYANGLNLSSIIVRDVVYGNAIRVDNSDKISLSNIQVKNVTHSGIFVYNSENSLLKDILVESSNDTGVYLSNFDYGFVQDVNSKYNKNGFSVYNSRNNSFSRLILSDNQIYGLHLDTSNNSVWTDIQVSGTGFYNGNSVGMYIDNGGRDRFFEVSLFNNNQSGLMVLNSNLLKFSNLAIERNYLVDYSVDINKVTNSSFDRISFIGNLGGFLVQDSNSNTFLDGVFSGNLGGFSFKLYNSSENKIINSTFEGNNGSGLEIKGSNNSYFSGIYSGSNNIGMILFESPLNNIFNSEFINNREGIVFSDSSNNTLNNSKIKNSYFYGIVFKNISKFIIISNNYIEDNRYAGLFINNTNIGITGNKIYNNYFRNNNNAIVAFAAGENYWNIAEDRSKLNIYGTLGFGGNYWSDYSPVCKNTNGDNFCDDFYNISGSTLNKDLRPIAQYQTSGNCLFIDSCRNLSSSFASYCLNKSIIINSGTCFNINGQNITLDCQNNLIDGNGTANIGINISGQDINSGIKIKNCKINNLSNLGMIIEGTDGVTIESNVFSWNNKGILVNSDFNFINANFSNHIGDAIQMSGQNNTLSYVNVYGTGNSSFDLRLSSSSNTKIFNSEVSKVSVSSDKLYILKNGLGEIKFNEPISGIFLLNQDIKLLSNLIQINHSISGIMNKSASIILFGIDYVGNLRFLLRDNVICNSTTNPSCTLISGLGGSNVSFTTSSTGDFKVGGNSLIVSSPTTGVKISANYTLFSYNLSLLPGIELVNCTLVINNETEKVFYDSDGDYKYNITAQGRRYDWNFSCIDEDNNVLSYSSWFNATSSSSTSNNNNNNNNPSGTVQNDSIRACAWISGANICASDQTCNGTFTLASDTSRCCVGGCVGGSTTQVITPIDEDDCDLSCQINEFFSNKTNLIITLIVIGIVILFIVILFVYSFKSKKNSERIRIFQDQQRPSFGGSGSLGLSQYGSIQPRPVSQPLPSIRRPASLTSSSDKEGDDSKSNSLAINAARLSLRNYILKEIKRGVSESDIKEVLSKANWKESEINSAMTDVKKFVEKSRKDN